MLHTHLPSPEDTSLALPDSWIQGARARLAPPRSAGKCLEQREDEPMSSAGQPSVAPAEMKSPPPRPAPALLPVEVQSEDPDKLFNALARARWSRPGHSNRPEPFSLVMQGIDGTGNVSLGGMPYL